MDQTSGFGTFPLESMKMGIPVIGVLPHLQPEWLNEDNGLWIVNKNSIVDVVADFIQNWLEDNINPELYTEMEKTAEKYINMEEFKNNVINIFSGILEKRMMSFEEQLNKLETIE
jgi:glycosyltransferase involved in cell wall biosynthesis